MSTPDPTTTSPVEPATTSPPTPDTAPPPTAETVVDPDLNSAGIAVALPDGWEGVIYRREPSEPVFADDVPQQLRRPSTVHAVAHLANFPLPVQRGDFGSGAVEIMANQHMLIVLFEFEPESAAQPMFASDGLPRQLRPDDFDPMVMQRPLPGMAGVQRFFNIEGRRAFCLYVVIGSYEDRTALTREVNEVLANIEIRP